MKNGITHENLGQPIEEYTKEQLEKMVEVFVCFDFLCNLNCPHCTLKLIPQHRQLDKIYNTMKIVRENNTNQLTFNLFGGEPLLLSDEDFKIIEEFFYNTRIILSTNLLSKLTDYKIKLMTMVEDVNTSWNPLRFTEEQYKLWLNQLDILNKNNIHYSVMVTLTKDLIEQSPESFLERVLTWKNCRNIDMKQMIGDDTIDFNKVDDWLCKLYNIWNIEKPLNLIFNEIKQVVEEKRIWKNYCETTTTIMPDGKLKNGCPYFEYKTDKSFCLSCEYYPICKGGCNIQERCTFPKKLYNLIRKNYGKS